MMQQDKPETRNFTIATTLQTESARIVPDEVVVKKASHTWVDRPGPGLVKAKTRELLDGAVARGITLGKREAVSSSSRPPALTPLRWVYRLAGAYHLTHPTPRLMEEAAQRFDKADRERLKQWAAQKAREEGGHDRLALIDLETMGYQAKLVVEALFPPVAAALVDYFSSSVYAPDPIGCVGYFYAMERLATGIDEKYIRAVNSLLPPGIQATRCLRVHSSVGSDMEHVEETVEMVAGLTPEERARVAAACCETALLCFSPPKEDYISEEELHNVLKPLESHNLRSGKS